MRGFARPNLRLRAVEVRGASERRQRTDAQLAEAIGEAASPRGSAIIYTRTRRQSEEESERLAQRGWRVACYHAGLESRERSRVSAAFAAVAVFGQAAGETWAANNTKLDEVGFGS